MDENNNTSNTENNEGGSSKWAWVVAVAVIAALVAFYVWPKREAAEPSPVTNTAAEEVDVSTRSLESVGTSDEAADIEKDLNDTNLLDLDREIGDLESEIGSQ